ncbi:hypothetical protein [Argonema galeatum]|nr:hypothetical protein [Argonema galeatum]MCL1468083.1 hypothetical protein [Argonema galeatum A003/A1]
MMLEWHKNDRRANKLKVPSVSAFLRHQQNKGRTQCDEKIVRYSTAG